MAYDSADRNLLYRVLALFGVPQKIITTHSPIPRWHESMRAAGRQGVLGVVRCGIGSSSKVRAPAPPVQYLLCGGYSRDLNEFQGGQRHHKQRFGASEEETGGGGQREATAEEPVLATPLWSMLYADTAGVIVVSQSSEQLNKMKGVIVIVCVAI